MIASVRCILPVGGGTKALRRPCVLPAEPIAVVRLTAHLGWHDYLGLGVQAQLRASTGWKMDYAAGRQGRLTA